MTPRARLWTSLIGGAVLCPFLPLYVTRSMTRSMVIGEAGDRIEFGWRLHTLGAYLDAMTFMRPEEHPQRMLAVNLGLAVVYAGALALVLRFILTRATAK